MARMFLPPRQEATIGFALLDGVNERVCFLFLTAAFFRFYEALASKIKNFLEEQKMFKKIASLTLALIMMLGACFALSSCGEVVVADMTEAPLAEVELTKDFEVPADFKIGDYAKAFDCVDHNKLWKILKETGISDHLICLLRNCMQVRKQQLELDMEQQTGSK